MYDFSGIYIRMLVAITIFGVMGLGLIIMSRFRRKEKFNKKNLYKEIERKKDFITGCVSVLCMIIFMLHYSNAINDPQIVMETGVFSSAYRRQGHYFYGIDTKLHLDPWTEGKLIPGGFIEGEEYRIYYEDRTNVIVRVEKID